MAKNGYAFDNRESAEYSSCLAVPVRDNQGNIIAALSFSGFVGVEDHNSLLKYLPALQKASSEISHQMYRCWER